MKKLRSDGFTIIELMISTVVFAMVLLVITAAIVQFGRMYYKGVIQSRTQETTRSVVNSISQDIQFSRQKPVVVSAAGFDGIICIGEKRYAFKKFVDPGTHPALISYTSPTCAPPGSGTNTREMLGARMQLLGLETPQEIGSNSGLYRVSVWIGYGKDYETSINDSLPSNIRCSTVPIDGQFCAISSLSTTVQRRLN